MKSFFVLLVSAALLLGLAGCGGSAEAVVVRYDIPGPVENLDPQFATGATARMIAGNIFEGLVIQDSSGSILPGVAESYTISEDSLQYTFLLREDACWSDGAPLTSADFYYSFQRLFNTASPSPFAADYSCIRNASRVLAGTAPIGDLGISVPDERTVEFILEHPNPFFLELLAAPPAMPCNEEFFLGARGRYGLEPKLVYGNGPFSLDKWDNTKQISLRKSKSYFSERPSLAEGVNLYIGRGDSADLFLDNKSDLAVIPYGQLPKGSADAAPGRSFETTTWCIVFNQSDPIMGNPLIRQALLHTLDHKKLEEQLEPNYTPTGVFVPPSLRLLDKPYRSLAGSDPPLAYDTGQGSRLFAMGLKSLELEAFPAITLYVPDTGSHAAYMGLAQQDWQKHLGAYINTEAASMESLERRLQTGDFQMLLMPFTPSAERVSSHLGLFSGGSPGNYTGYQNPRYDSILHSAQDEDTVAGAAAKYKQAEMILLSDVVILPVYFETITYAINPDIQGIDISPFAEHIYFKYAHKP